jgi:ribosomal subunit interface protein
MQNALQVTFRNMPPSEALEARIREKAAKLEKFHPHITSCHVTVEEGHRHHAQGRHFSVRIDVHVPGREAIVSNMHHDEDPYVALRDAYEAVRRQLEESAREMRGEVKFHESSRRP